VKYWIQSHKSEKKKMPQTRSAKWRRATGRTGKNWLKIIGCQPSSVKNAKRGKEKEPAAKVGTAAGSEKCVQVKTV